jgi:hypothetical protein
MPWLSDLFEDDAVRSKLHALASLRLPYPRRRTELNAQPHRNQNQTNRVVASGPSRQRQDVQVTSTSFSSARRLFCRPLCRFWLTMTFVDEGDEILR